MKIIKKKTAANGTMSLNELAKEAEMLSRFPL
jgi:hypothetical protein